MIEEVAGIDTCVPWIPEGMCSWIVFCWHRTLHDTCRHVDRGRSHSNGFDRLDQNKSGEELPMKQQKISRHPSQLTSSVWWFSEALCTLCNSLSFVSSFCVGLPTKEDKTCIQAVYQFQVLHVTIAVITVEPAVKYSLVFKKYANELGSISAGHFPEQQLPDNRAYKWG